MLRIIRPSLFSRQAVAELTGGDGVRHRLTGISDGVEFGYFEAVCGVAGHFTIRPRARVTCKTCQTSQTWVLQ